MRVYSLIEWDENGEVINAEFSDYEGPVAECKGGGGGGSTTTVQKADPWAGVQPYLTEVYKNSAKLYGAGGLNPTPYSGGTIAPLSADTQAALNMTRQRAQLGSPLVGAAQTQAQSTLQGDYLNAGNPYLQNALRAAAQPTVENFRDAVLPGLEARSALSGRYGSGGQRELTGKAYDSLARGLSEQATQAYAQNYANERQNQLAAMEYAPTLAAEDYKDAERLAAVGDYIDQYDQSKINADILKYEETRDAPYNALVRYINLIEGGGSMGGTTSATQTNNSRSNPLLGAAGGALSGYGMFGPLGAIGGGLLGLFG